MISTSRALPILMKSDAICLICLFSWSVCEVGNYVCALQISEMIPNAILSGRLNERISAVSWPRGQLKEPIPSDSRPVMAEADVILRNPQEGTKTDTHSLAVFIRCLIGPLSIRDIPARCNLKWVNLLATCKKSWIAYKQTLYGPPLSSELLQHSYNSDTLAANSKNILFS